MIYYPCPIFLGLDLFKIRTATMIATQNASASCTYYTRYTAE